MDDNEYHQIFIKTDVEKAEGSYHPYEELNLSEACNSISDGTETNLIDVKLEPGTKLEYQNDEILLASECKPETKIELHDEFCIPDIRSIYSDVKNEYKLETKIEDDCCISDTRSTNSEDYNESMADEITDESEIRFASKSNEVENFKHKCDKCDYITNNKSNLKEHQAKHSDEKPFNCDNCSFQAKTKNRLRQHQYVHKELRPFKCNICSFKTKYKCSLRKHEYTHTNERPFRCDKCYYSTKHKYLLVQHQLRHTKEEQFNCGQCENCTPARHSVLGGTETNLIDVKLEPDTKLEDHNEKFMLTSECKSEMKVDTNNGCCNPNRGNKILMVQSTTQSIKPKKHKCNKCEYMTNFLYRLNRHLTTHSDEKPFKCDKCDYETSSKHHLKQHQFRHSEIRPFKCNKCSSQFKTLRHLEKHKSVHIKVKPYGCDKCSYRAKFKENLNRHIVKHLNSKAAIQKLRPFKCDKCCYRAKSKEVLNDHQTLHSELIQFKCDKCFYRTKIKNHLKVHQANAHRLSCDKCNFKTKFEQSLDQHRLIHQSSEGDSKVLGKTNSIHLCDTCGYRTNSMKNLELHQLLIHKKDSQVESDATFTLLTTPDSIGDSLMQSKSKHCIQAVRGKTNSIHLCDTCGYRTNSRKNLELHQLLIHKKDSQVESDATLSLLTTPDSIGDSLIQSKPKHCIQAAYDSNLKDECESKNSTQTKPTSNKNVFNFENNKKALKKQQRKQTLLTQLKCNKCSFQAKGKDILKRHQLVHEVQSSGMM